MRTTRQTHLSAQRLLDAARALHPGSFQGQGPWADLGRFLNEADQTVNNWRSRGVPRSRVHDLAARIGCNWQWVLTGEGEMTASGTSPAISAPRAPEAFSPAVLHMALKFVRNVETRTGGRLPDDEFARLTLSVADWIDSLDKSMTEEDERRFSLMLEKLVTGMSRPLGQV